MANAFKRAASKVEPTKAAKPVKETAWLVGSDPNGDALSEAIVEVNECQKKAKELEARADMFKLVLKQFADDKWASHMALNGVAPETPMKIVNREGKSVTFVVQDRATGHKISPEVQEALGEILGPGAIGEIVYEQTVFGFEPLIMASPAADGSGLVQDVVGDAITATLEQLVADGKLTQAQYDGLLTAKTTHTFKPGFLPRLPELCGRNVGRFASAIAAVGSACVRYVKC